MSTAQVFKEKLEKKQQSSRHSTVLEYDGELSKAQALVLAAGTIKKFQPELYLDFVKFIKPSRRDFKPSFERIPRDRLKKNKLAIEVTSDVNKRMRHLNSLYCHVKEQHLTIKEVHNIAGRYATYLDGRGGFVRKKSTFKKAIENVSVFVSGIPRVSIADEENQHHLPDGFWDHPFVKFVKSVLRRTGFPHERDVIKVISLALNYDKTCDNLGIIHAYRADPIVGLCAYEPTKQRGHNGFRLWNALSELRFHYLPQHEAQSKGLQLYPMFRDKVSSKVMEFIGWSDTFHSDAKVDRILYKDHQVKNSLYSSAAKSLSRMKSVGGEKSVPILSGTSIVAHEIAQMRRYDPKPVKSLGDKKVLTLKFKLETKGIQDQFAKIHRESKAKFAKEVKTKDVEFSIWTNNRDTNSSLIKDNGLIEYDIGYSDVYLICEERDQHSVEFFDYFKREFDGVVTSKVLDQQGLNRLSYKVNLSPSLLAWKIKSEFGLTNTAVEELASYLHRGNQLRTYCDFVRGENKLEWMDELSISKQRGLDNEKLEKGDNPISDDERMVELNTYDPTTHGTVDEVQYMNNSGRFMSVKREENNHWSVGSNEKETADAVVHFLDHKETGPLIEACNRLIIEDCKPFLDNLFYDVRVDKALQRKGASEATLNAYRKGLGIFKFPLGQPQLTIENVDGEWVVCQDIAEKRSIALAKAVESGSIFVGDGRSGRSLSDQDSTESNSTTEDASRSFVTTKSRTSSGPPD